MNKTLIKLCTLLMTILLIMCAGCTNTNQDNTPTLDNKPHEETEIDVLGEYWSNPDLFGLTVDEHGTLMLGENSFTAFGVNVYSMFNCSFKQNKKYDTTSSKKAIDTLVEYNIPIARINIAGYGKEWIERYKEDTSLWFKTFDEVVNYANEHKIGLIFSFIWNPHSVPAYFEGQCADYGVTTSETFKFVEEFTTEVVSRYKDNKAVWGWELGNEWNLITELDKHNPTNTNWTGFGKLSTNDYLTIANSFNNIVTSIDNHGRIISSGNAKLRLTQYNQSLPGTNLKGDTWEEHCKITKTYHPANFNMITEHIYDYPGEREYRVSLEKYLTDSVNYAKSIGKNYCLGEWNMLVFDDPARVWDPKTKDYTGEKMTIEWNMEHMEEACNIILKSGVQLTLFWNYDPEDIVEHSFCATNPQGTVAGATHKKYGKFLLPLMQKLNTVTIQELNK